MRIRFGLGLPGPFYLTSSSRGRTSLAAAVAFLAAVFTVLALASPWLACAVAAFLTLAVVCVVHDLTTRR